MGALFSCGSRSQRVGGVEEFPLHSGNLRRQGTIIDPQPSPSINRPLPIHDTSTVTRNVSPSRQSYNTFETNSYSPSNSTSPEGRPTRPGSNLSDIPTSWTPSSDLIIGIDFGTTFTGVAYAHAAGLGPITSEAEMRRAAEKVSVIRTWPSRSNQYVEKTPSILAYNRNPPLWGGNVRPHDEPQIAHFKLGLQEDIIGHYYSEQLGPAHDKPTLGGYLLSHNWRHPKLPDMTAVDYSRDYLHSINEYVTKEILPTRFGARFLQNQSLSYVITVPAIWSDKAKQETRQAAQGAGIDRSALTLITEPEAAALYCATLCDEVDLEPGDRFMICDAGGGTDLIAYKVISQTPFRIEECTVGTGAACGAIYLDQGFETWLRNKFGEVQIHLDERRVTELCRHFDNSIKLQFNPFDPLAETEFEIPISGIQDLPSIGLQDGYLIVTRSSYDYRSYNRADLQPVFDNIFNQILRLVKDQIDTVRFQYGERIKTLFLVGGLGSSLYLLKFLESKLRGLVSVKQPEAGYTAIMRGAVLYKLGLDFVKDRVMRVSYGTAARVPFEEGRHPISRKGIDYDGKARCSGVMHWFAKKGISLASGTTLDETFYSDRKLLNDLVSVNTLYISSDDTPPEYEDPNRLKAHVKLTVNLGSLPAEAWQTRQGVSRQYRRVFYQLGLAFGPGGIEWRFLYKGKVIGSVECEYS